MAWKEEYDKHLCDRNVEIELRAGKQTSSGFKTDVGKEIYDNVLKQLESNKWDSIEEIDVEDVFYKNNVRKSGSEYITKENIYKNNKRSGKFDIRFAINIENPVNKVTGSVKTTRKKHRKSFTKQFYRFDVTHVKNDNTYEVEMELVDISYAKKHSYEFIMGNMLNKFNSLMSSANF